MQYFKIFLKVNTLALLLALCFVPATPTFGQTKICDEDFENVTPGDIPEVNPTGTGEIPRCGRAFYGQDSPADGAFLASGGNPGQCATAHLQSEYISGDSYTMPSWDFDNSLGGSRQLYIKFDFRVDAALGTSNANREVYNFKLCRMTDAADASGGLWIPTINFQPSSSSYSLYHWTTYETSEYYFHRATTKRENHMMDNQWHTYEVFIDIGVAVVADKNDDSADGIVRIWEDGILILEDTKACFREGPNDGTELNSVMFIRHAKSAGAPVFPMEGHVDFDNLEVWTGMPGGGGGDTNPPQTAIDSGPSGTIDYDDVTFTFSGSDDTDPPSSLVFSHRMDSDSWSSYSSSTSAAFTDLSDGAHVFQVRARDTSGNVDQSPASDSFTVETGGDTTPPDPPENVDAEAIVDP